MTTATVRASDCVDRLELISHLKEHPRRIILNDLRYFITRDSHPVFRRAIHDAYFSSASPLQNVTDLDTTIHTYCTRAAIEVAKRVLETSLSMSPTTKDDEFTVCVALRVLYSHPSLIDMRMRGSIFQKMVEYESNTHVVFLALAVLVCLNDEDAIRTALRYVPKPDAYAKLVKCVPGAGLVVLLHELGRKATVDELVSVLGTGGVGDAAIPYLVNETLTADQNELLQARMNPIIERPEFPRM